MQIIPARPLMSFSTENPSSLFCHVPRFMILSQRVGSASSRSVEGTPTTLRGIKALVRQMEADTGIPLAAEGVCYPGMHGACYCWRGEGGLWSIRLVDCDEQDKNLSECARGDLWRRQMSRALWHNRKNPHACIALPEYVPA